MVRRPDPARLRAQGAVSFSPRGGWRLGWLTLGDAALAFSPPGSRESLRICLAGVARVARERRTFVISPKPVIRITYRTGQALPLRNCWLITSRLGAWEAALLRYTGVAAGTGPPYRDLAAGLAALTPTARLLLDYLAQRGYATTADLVSLTGAATEEALPRWLREGLGGLEQALGGPAIHYVGLHYDQRSRQVIRHAWRLDEAIADRWLAAGDPADVLVEGDELMVVTSLPTQARGAPLTATIAADGRGLTVQGAHGCRRTIVLPEQVAGEALCTRSATGTLTIRVRRKRQGTGPAPPAWHAPAGDELTGAAAVPRRRPGDGGI